MEKPEGWISVEVAYALPQRQTLLTLAVPAGSSLRDTIERSGILQHHPQIDLTCDTVGIFSRLASLDEAVGEGDRIEIYRPLAADPKEVRRRRAAQARRR